MGVYWITVESSIGSCGVFLFSCCKLPLLPDFEYYFGPSVQPLITKQLRNLPLSTVKYGRFNRLMVECLATASSSNSRPGEQKSVGHDSMIVHKTQDLGYCELLSSCTMVLCPGVNTILEVPVQ